MKIHLLCLTLFYAITSFSLHGFAIASKGEWQPANCCGIKEINYLLKYYELKGVWGSSSKDLFIVGMKKSQYRPEGIILHFNGNKWRIIKETDFRLNCIWGTSANHVFVGGGKLASSGSRKSSESIILHYNGEDWQQMEFEQDPRYAYRSRRLSLSKNPNNFYEGGPPIVSIWGGSEDNIYAAGNGSGSPIFHFDGQIWVKMDSDRSPYLKDIHGASDQNIYAVGTAGSGKMMHYDGISWTPLRKGEFNAVWCSQFGTVFAVGDNGKILHYNSETWDETELETTLYDVYGIADNDVYVVGKKGSIFHYDGKTWHQMDSGTEKHLYAIWASTPAAIYAVGGDGTILRYANKSEKKTRWEPSEAKKEKAEAVVEKKYEIRLKDGRTIVTRLQWEEGNFVCYHKYGATMKLPKSDIKEIVVVE